MNIKEANPKVPMHFIGFLANVDDSITALDLGEGLSIERLSQRDARPFRTKIEFHWGVRDMPLATGSLGDPSGSYCVVKRNAAKFEPTTQGGVIAKYGTARKIHACIQDKLRLLRLFREGNVTLEFSCLYHNDLSFLSLMIAMEILFNPKDAHQELRYRVSRNTAVLLGKSSEDGDKVFKEIKGLYDKRSKLVHTGDKTALSRADVLNLRRYVRESIKEMLQTPMNKEDLLELLNSCGFGQRPWENT